MRALPALPQPVAVRITHTAGRLHAQLLSDAPTDTEALLWGVRAVSGAQRDLSAFYEAARHDGRLWGWLAAIEGMPLFHSPDLYEALVTTIIEQHISWASALKVQARFTRLYGQPLGVVDGLYAMPAPQTIAALAPADLAPLKLTGARLELLVRVSRLLAEGAFERWRSASPPELYERLLRVQGIGPWTAAVTAGRALGIQPALHDSDAALQAAVNHYFHGRAGRAAQTETRAVFAPWGSDAPLAANLLMMRWVIDRYEPLPFDV